MATNKNLDSNDFNDLNVLELLKEKLSKLPLELFN
jgi:hypothetical protein|nr:MAG TPA: hypothetical protein [Caudoviricetes sp.]